MVARADAVLLADIGGTNARFALYQDGSVGPITRLKVADYPGPGEAIAAFVAQIGRRTVPPAAAFAVAGPVIGDSTRLTNGTWEFSGAALRSTFNFKRLEMVNDFVAVALALPHLTAGDVAQVGGGRGTAQAPLAVIGPGTGLGVAALLGANRPPVVIASEGGHVTLAARDTQESALLDRLRGERGHVSAEDVVSGPGLVTLYDEIAARDGVSAPPRDPEGIVAAGLSGACAASGAALDMFCAFLGGFAGNVALTFGAQGGVYLAGGIVPSLVEYLKGSRFRARFEDKGPLRAYLADIPCYVITRPEPAFLGLAHLAAGY